MKTLSFLFVLIFLSIVICGQDRHRVNLNVNYSVNIPTGNFADYVNQPSYRGWNANVTYRLNEKIAIGGTIGFQDFYEKTPRAVYKNSDGSDISAVVTNSIQTIPLMATVHYLILPDQPIQPYAGLSAGGNFIMHNQYLGQFAINKDKVGLAVRPEIGVFIPIKKDGGSGINLSAAFNFMPYNEGSVKNLNSWGINAGIKFPLR